MDIRDGTQDVDDALHDGDAQVRGDALPVLAHDDAQERDGVQVRGDAQVRDDALPVLVHDDAQVRDDAQVQRHDDVVLDHGEQQLLVHDVHRHYCELDQPGDCLHDYHLGDYHHHYVQGLLNVQGLRFLHYENAVRK